MASDSKKRIAYLDLARGFGMLAVIWGHIHTSGWSYVLVYAFDIPLFFFLSGMMYRKEKNTSFRELILRLYHKLFIPYFCFSIVTWVIMEIPWLYFDIKAGTLDLRAHIYPLIQTFVAQGSGGYMIHNVPLWFVTGLCVVNILYYFVSKFHVKTTILCSIGAAILGNWMVNNGTDFDFTKLPWNVESACSGLLFFAIGNLLAEHFGRTAFDDFYLSKKSIALISMIACAIVFVPGALWNGHISLGSNSLGKSAVVLYIVGFAGTFAVLILSVWISHLKNNPVKAYIQWIGEHSFYFMAVHMVIYRYLMLAESVVFKILDKPGTTLQESVWGMVAEMLIVLLGSACVVYILIYIRQSRKKLV